MDLLETPRLLLRPFAAGDAVLVHEVYSDPEVMRYVATGPMSDIAVTERLLADYTAHQRRHGYSFWAVIERASVEGKVFHRGAVVELSASEIRAEVGSYLQTLVRKELVRPDQADFPGEDAFRFRHLLIRDAAYDAMAKELRAELHERLAAWLEQAAGDRVLGPRRASEQR